MSKKEPSERPPSTSLTWEERARELQKKLAEAEEALESIRSGRVDAVIGHEGPTLLHEALKALKETEAQYRFLFKNMNEGYAHCKVIYDKSRPVDVVYLTVNEAFGRLTGLYNVEGKRITEVIPGFRESNPDLLGIYGEVARTGEPAQFETFVHHLDMWFAISVYSPARDHFVAIFQVITERKRTEEALRSSEERFRALVENQLEGVIIVDFSETISYCNSSAAEIFGVNREAVTGQNLRAFVDEASFKRIRRQTSSRKRGKTDTYEITVVRQGGEKRLVRLTASPLKNPAGDFSEAFGILFDVTEYRAAEAALQEAREALVRAKQLETVGMIASGVAHEVRNPLFAISTIVTALERKLQGHEEFGEYVAHIKDQTDRLNALMKDLLELGRPIKPKDFKSCRLQDIASQALTLIVDSSPEARNRCRKHFSQKPLPVLSMPDQLVQVIFNLLHNALTIDKNGGEVHLTLRRKNGRGILEVRDCGPGIPPGLLPRLFQPFQTGRKGGTGLGLAIVRKIVAAHDGSVDVANNAPPPGATFTVSLPLLEETGRDAAKAPRRSPRPKPGS